MIPVFLERAIVREESIGVLPQLPDHDYAGCEDTAVLCWIVARDVEKPPGEHLDRQAIV
jgi:hypothetical protein